MNELPRCPKCDCQLPSDAPAGLCPKCLVKAGFESQPTPLREMEPTHRNPARSGFELPSIEDMAGRFPQLEILELIGKGGMGAVYKARQPGLDRLVAVKILPPEISHDPAFAERFQREARALARLSHPHIVAVYDFGVVGQAFQPDAFPRSGQAGKPDLRDGLCYIVMEFVDGANLRQAIRTGKLTSTEALAIVPQICEALQFAHDEGIVHRDIKPENILIDKRGRVKIADFGLAKLLGQDASDHPLTATHQVMGTLRYMAPEQMQGSREVDHRADIYSLGVVFYELLTGELPMGKFAPPSKRVQVDVRLDEIVLRALEQEPEQRYQQASEVKTDVDAISRDSQPPNLNTQKRAHQDGRTTHAEPVSLPFEIAESVHWGLFGGVHGKLRLEKNELVVEFEVRSLFPVFRSGLKEVSIPFDDIESVNWDGWDLTICTRTIKALAEIPRSSQGQVAFDLSMTDLDVPGGISGAAEHFMASLPRRMVAESVSVARLDSAKDMVIPFEPAPAEQIPVSMPQESKRRKRTEDAARAESAKGTAIGPHLVQAPADCLLLAAGVAFVTTCGVAVWLGVPTSLGRDVANLSNPMIRGNLIGMSIGLAIYSVFIGVAGLMLRRLRVRLVVLLVAAIVGLFFPAVCALNVVMELRNIPVWPVVIPLWLGMPTALWAVVRLFRDDVRRAFDAAAEQRAQKLLTEKSGERLGVSPPCDLGDPGHGGLTPSRSPSSLPAARPKLVPVLATFNLGGAMLLMLACAMEEPAEFARSVPRFWQVWETVDAVLGFSMAAGIFAASIGLFLWKPWARKLTLGVCVFGLASFVFDAPYLARFLLPDAWAEIQQTVIAEGVEPEAQDFVTLSTIVVLFGGMLVVGLTCLIGQLVYFTRPRVVAAFESPIVEKIPEVTQPATGPGRISLRAAISGVVLPVLLLIGSILLSIFVSIPDGIVIVCFLLGLGLEMVAVGCGIVSGRTPSGKAGLIIGSISLVLWLAILAIIPTQTTTYVSAPEGIVEYGSSVAQLPPLGTITSGIGAEFTVPAGQVAVFEVVTRRDSETVPVPPHCGYVIAPPDTPVAGTFRWSHKPDRDSVADGGQEWSLEILTAGGGRVYSETTRLPEELNEIVGASGLALGLLEPNVETIHWGTADANDLPANGLIGLRVTVVPHGLKAGGSGNGHIDWKESQTRQSTSRREIPTDTP